MAANDITLRKQATLQGTVVKLGDVADVQTADVLRQKQLAALPLMPAPAPGTQRFLRKREIQDLLAAHGEDISQLQFAGGEQVEIVSPSGARETAVRSEVNDPTGRLAAFTAGKVLQQIEAKQVDGKATDEARETLRRTIVDYLNSNTGRKSAWRVSCDVSDRYLTQLNNATSAPSCRGGEAPWTGRQRLTISFNTAEGMVQLPIYAEVVLAVPVVVATRAIANGAVITGADIEMRQVDNPPAASDRRAPLDDVEKLVGMEAARSIQAGDVILSDQVRAPILVKRGEKVTVTTQGSGIRVRNMARVRQDGSRGDLVQVESLETKERYDARVVGLQEVAVLAPMRTTAAKKLETQADKRWR